MMLAFPLFLTLRKVLVLILTGTLFFGCSLSKNQATRFYVLNPMEPSQTLRSDADHQESLSVEVASLRLPQYLERPQIVTRSSENQLDLAEFHQWGGNLRKDMMRVFAKNLSQLLDTPHISFSNHSSQTSPDFVVELEIIKFEKDPDEKVRLSAQWRLSSGKDRKPMTTQISELESLKLNSDPEMEQTVATMSTILGEFSKMIGLEIFKQAAGRIGPGN